MASDPEIKDGFTLPVWMKSKPTKEFESFAASPPPPEDSFFYIRYPKTNLLPSNPKVDQDVAKLLNDKSKEISSPSIYQAVKDKDWSKHTKPCQEVLMHGITPVNTAVNPISSKPKPAGTDDGFKGEGAACGNSIVKMAHEMMSSTRSPRGFVVAAPPDEEAVAPDPQHYNMYARRGSKSLPASPSTSPTSRRRKNTNRYFTSPFEPVEDGSGRSWLTAALLGYKKDLMTSSSTLAEEDTLEARLQVGSLAESVDNLGPAPRAVESKLLTNEAGPQQPKAAKPAHALRPKPSELRELNFWSPTSM